MVAVDHDEDAVSLVVGPVENLEGERIRDCGLE
jgi:hypothetical protein